MIRLFPLLLAAAAFLPAQNIGVGVKGGVPLKDSSEVVRPQFTNLREWDLVVGPMIELRLPAGLGIELNALYRRGGVPDAWEFPLLAKYRFPGILIRPTIGAGYIFRRFNDIPGLENRHGVAASGGVEFKLPKVRITPEIRYSRYNEQRPSSGFLTGTHQFDLLVGLSF